MYNWRRRKCTRIERLEEGELSELGAAVVGHERVDVHLVLAHVGPHPRLAHHHARLAGGVRPGHVERDRVADDDAQPLERAKVDEDQTTSALALDLGLALRVGLQPLRQ
jgi:hypothetical protein